MWQVVHAVAVLLVLGFFLFSLRGLLNPFLLFLLLVVLLSPYAGSRQHLLLVGTAGVLTLIWILGTTGFLLAPFILALVLAYVLHPLVDRIQRWRIGRSLAVTLLMLPIVGAIVLAVVVGIPLLGEQIAIFIRTVPDLIDSAVGFAERAQIELARRDIPYVDEDALLERIRGIQPEVVIGALEARQAELAQRAWAAILGAGRGISSILTILSYVFLTPILTFYLLRDFDGLTGRMASLLPLPRREPITAFAREYDRLLSRYLRGQLLAASVVGVLTWLGFWLLDFPYAFLLGAVAGIFNVVPYLGLIVSLIPALVIALFSGAILLSLGKIALVFFLVQLLDGSVIGPRIVGESVGLHPVWVILALAVSGFFFGFVGLLLAIPLAVLVKLLLATALTRYERSRLFRGGAAALVDRGKVREEKEVRG